MKTTYIRPTKVRALVGSLGKKLSRGYVVWLDALVERTVRVDAQALGSRVILNRSDAEARQTLSKIRR